MDATVAAIQRFYPQVFHACHVRHQRRRSNAFRLSERDSSPFGGTWTFLLASKDGPTLDRALRSFLAVADPHVGHENLKTVTLLPDEHASKGVSVLNWADSARRGGVDISGMLDPRKSDVEKIHKEHPEYSREEITHELRRYAASEGVKQLTEGEAANVSFAGAWNSDGHIVVMPEDQFAAWLAAAPSTASLVEQGQTLFRALGCSGCHGPSATVRAPKLEGLYGHPVGLTRGQTVIADDGYIRDSILQPKKDVVGGFEPIMPSFQGLITEDDLGKLVAYIKSLANAGVSP